MHVLVTGGTGVIGRPVIDRLTRGGHTVRLLSRHAERDRCLWPEGVEAHEGSVASAEEVEGAAEGCDAVLHITGIIEEQPPDLTFDNINVEGTRRIVREAERAGASRLVHVSSLGADRGSSDYHRSKRASEQAAQEFSGEWIICRSGNVYGPGDDVISLLFQWVRSLPAVPIVVGERVFQPVWAEDLADALVMALEGAADGNSPQRKVLELAGTERVTMTEVLDEIERITDRHPQRIPVPEWVALAGTELAKLAGVPLPVNVEQIKMLIEENAIVAGRPNALTEVFGITPTPLTTALERLANALPERLPREGVGPMLHQRYWTDVTNARVSADELFELFREDFSTLFPRELLDVGAEPGAPTAVEEGATLTMRIPVRGHIQVRVLEVRERKITCVTVEGHHLAGVIRFQLREHDEGIRFEVRSFARASQLLDELGMAAVGHRLQERTWTTVVEEVARRYGDGAPADVQTMSVELSDERAHRVEQWVDQLVMARRRQAVAGA